MSGTNPITDSPVVINTYINSKSSFVGGLELIGRNSVTKWWDITSNINIFTSQINLVDTGKTAIPTAGQIYSWFGKINNTFKLPKNFTLQLTGDYTSKTVLPPGGSASNGNSQGGGGGFGNTVSGNAQGYSKPTGGVDAALKFEFLKAKAASLTLSVSDIFRTRISDVYTTSSDFNQEVYRRRDPQFFRLQFNYRFGKFDVALFKRKNLKGEMESIQGGMQGAQQSADHSQNQAAVNSGTGLRSIDTIQAVRIRLRDIRRFYIGAVVPELDPCRDQDLKGFVLLGLAGEIG